MDKGSNLGRHRASLQCRGPTVAVIGTSTNDETGGPTLANPPPPQPDPSDNPVAEVQTRQLTGFQNRLVTTLAAGLSLYALYAVVAIVQPQVYRVSFLLISLVLTFILYPTLPAWRGRVGIPDWLLAGIAVVVLAWPIVDFDQSVLGCYEATPHPDTAS